jgi:hypothetical protein
MSARATTRGALKGVQKELQQARQAQQQQQGQQAGSSAAAVDASRHAGESLMRLTARAAVLDGRQKALKLTANALYVSPMLFLALLFVSSTAGMGVPPYVVSPAYTVRPASSGVPTALCPAGKLLLGIGGITSHMLPAHLWPPLSENAWMR